MAFTKEPHTVIEELTDDPSNALQYDDALERVLIGEQRDGYKFLAAVFGFLDRHSKFFSQADASKQLARLLRDVKQRSSRPTADSASKGSISASKPPAKASLPGHPFLVF